MCLFWTHKEDILENEGNRAVLDHSIFSTMGVNGAPKQPWLQTCFRISSLVFGRANTFIHVWKYSRLSKWWQKFHFWMNYPFKCYQWFAPSMNGIVNQGSKIIGIKQTGLSYSFDQFVLQKVSLLLLQIVLIHCSMNLKCLVRLNLKVTGIYILLFPLL